MTEGSTDLVLGDGTRRITAQGVPPELASIFVEGGLVPYLAKHRGFAAIG